MPFAQKFRGADPQALDLLEKMLVFDPRKRIDAGEALAHEYLAPYHDPTDEPVAPEAFDWSFNDADLPVDTWKVVSSSLRSRVCRGSSSDPAVLDADDVLGDSRLPQH